MKHIKVIAAATLWLVGNNVMAADKISSTDIDLLNNTFGTIVDQKGNISLPKDYRLNWNHMGSWVVLDAGAPGHGFHDVYAQKEAVNAYRKTGKFPDGSILVKEVRKVESGEQTTGKAHWAGSTNIWFVMVKDNKGRFPGNAHWQEGWGWALYDAKDPSRNVSKSFKETCMGCHTPAKRTDWVFINGYPTLKR
ncbi:MAG: cytochrome C [Methylotenera sp.]|jgi:hypothetical protein|uniref:cytochrome P460 family protein n=1 Tax=Methylotenera TaxID=359407 RepID=UPI00036DA1B6|nr:MULTISPECIES: cytochrome P460 family protein [Methylotenera]MDP3777578.1 cytochrome P460 family protein [Methylotenera sp.]PPC96341.1 MAG: cytochrome C [Methylotenera sp.]PPD00004.1 MAG: cytochrome C [Methylotenera sp.]